MTRRTTTAANNGSRRAIRWMVNAGILLIASLVGVVLAELAVRIVAPQQLVIHREDIWQPTDSLGWTRRGHVNTTINTGERTVRVITDADGFRIGEVDRADATIAILLIGDSFMAALQVDYGESVSGILERELSKALGVTVAVDDAGVGGWDPPQYLIAMNRAIAKRDYDYALVSLYVGNDIITRRNDHIPPVELSSPHLRIPRSLSLTELVDAVVYPTNEILETRLHLWVLLKNSTIALRTRLGLQPQPNYVPVEFRRDEAVSGRWSLTTQVIAEIVDAGKRRGVPTLAFLVPTPFQMDSASFAKELKALGQDPTAFDIDQPNSLLRDSLRARNIAVLDLLPALRQASVRGQQMFGAVDRHFTPFGHDVAAEALLPFLVHELWPIADTAERNHAAR